MPIIVSKPIVYGTISFWQGNNYYIFEIIYYVMIEKINFRKKSR